MQLRSCKYLHQIKYTRQKASLLFRPVASRGILHTSKKENKDVSELSNTYGRLGMFYFHKN